MRISDWSADVCSSDLQKVEDNIAPEIIARLESDCDYQARREAIRAFNASSPVLKRGIALTPVKFGISFTLTAYNQAGALVHIYRDGSIHLNHGGTEIDRKSTRLNSSH